VDHFSIREVGNGRMRMAKSGGQLCHYVLETADQLASNRWNWVERTTLSSTNGEVSLPAFSNTYLLMRMKVLIPE